MARRPAVLPEHLVHRRFHLRHGLGGAGVEGVLQRRLFGTGTATKGALECRVGAQDPVDVGDPLRPGQDANKAVVQFLDRRVMHGLLGHVDPVPNGAEEVQRAQVDAQRRQTGARRGATVGPRCGRLFHGG